MSQPLPFPSAAPKPQERFHRKYPRPKFSLSPHFPFSQQGLEQPFKQDLTAAICEALTASLKEYARHFVQYNRHGSDDRDVEYG